MKQKNPVSVQVALLAVLKAVKTGTIEKINLKCAAGFVTAAVIKSPADSPSFHNSAMDGYAFRFKDFIKGEPLQIIGEAAAGKLYDAGIKTGQAVRIFTGAEVPKGADTVVMQEKVIVNNSKLEIQDLQIKKGSNIRRAGSQIRNGRTALAKGHLINPATIGFLASLGIDEVEVFSKPKITIIITGNELVQPNKKPGPGQIFESNSGALLSALQNEGVRNVTVKYVKDNFDATLNAFRKACVDSDMVLFTGGISVGDYDFVGKILDEENTKEIFYGVKQKPGKPLYFGIKKDKLIFGLPGNPASVLTCFYEFVVPALRKWQHHPTPTLPKLKLPLKNSVQKKNGLTVFLKAHTDFNSVTVLEGQQSYIMKSFADANCFVVLDEQITEMSKGNMVEVHYFGLV